MLDAGLGIAAHLSRQLLWRAGEGPGIHDPLPRLHRLAGGIEQIDLDADDARERRRVTTDVVASIVDPAVERLHRGEVVLAVGVPGVGVAGGETEHALTAAADEDGWSLGTRAARAELAIAGGVVGALKVDVPGAQQGGNDLQRLLEAADAVVVGVAEGGVFGFVPAGAEPEDQPAAGDLVDGIGHLGDEGGVAEAGAGHEVSELHAPRCRCQRGQERPGVPGALLMDVGEAEEEVVRQPEGIEADLLGAPRQRRDIGPTEPAPAPGLLEVGNEEADLDWSPPSHLMSPL